MLVQQWHYEEVLAHCSNHLNAIELLKQYRPYLEMVPSMRRSEESLITIPLPIIQINSGIGGTRQSTHDTHQELICLPADVAFLMCDPEWKIKTGVEIFVLIHRPQEEFSQLLGRWRQTQVLLSKGYHWWMPPRYKHIFGEAADKTYPLFVLFEATPERIQRGLRGASLPFVVQTINSSCEDAQLSLDEQVSEKNVQLD